MDGLAMAAEELSVARKLQQHHLSSIIFLTLSNSLLQILDKIGPTMAVLRQDVHRNIERLEKLNLLDPSLYSSLGEILQKEQDEGTSRKQESRSRAILWLTRSMDFGLALLETVDKDSESSLEQMVDESYKSTLKPWHGWISSAAYKVALKLLPEKEVFISLLMGNGHDCEMLKGDIQTLVPLLRPFLDEIHALLLLLWLSRLLRHVFC